MRYFVGDRASWLAAMCAFVLLAAPARSAPALAPWSGGPAPALTLKGIDGRPYSLAAYRGKQGASRPPRPA